MDEIRQHLKSIRVATPHDNVYKDECVFSFDNPETSTGLYVSLTSFVGLGRDYVESYYKKSGHAVYLHIQRERREVVSSPPQGDGPEKKITRLAIGVEGGFNPESGHCKYEFHDVHHIVVLPNFTSVAWPNIDFPEIVIQSVQAILDMQSASKKAELEALAGTWDGETRQISKHAENLLQMDPEGKKIPPSGWVCEKCDKTENLWLNLTDGSILCGRRFYDGSGGNNHAVEHYEKTKHPLAVKLGTITKEGKGDIFSYVEDDLVEDPKLVDHLAHWGINVASMEKTEKSMVELELELNQKTNEWAALQESGGKLVPIYGPGYTGMTNMGNSCYLNSVLQMLFTVPSFVQTYYQEAPGIFETVQGDAAVDFNCQMAKLAVGVLSGKYSVPPPPGSPVDADPPGITPSMFKTLVGRGHPDFSTNHQQDAVEFFMYLMTLIERNSRNRKNPGECFKFKVEEKITCSTSNRVKYTNRADSILTLNIPLEAAVNKDEVSAYEQRKTETESLGGKRLEPDALVRPRIKLFSCLETFLQTEVIEQFYSTAINQKTSALKTTRLATFPDYLLIQLKKFTLREDWVPIKLDVAVEMPDLLDLGALRATGPQPGEEMLPEMAPSVVVQPQYDAKVMEEMIQMGFPENACKRALYFTQNSGLETAMAWVMQHIADSDFSDPFTPPGMEQSAAGTVGAGGIEADPDAVELIVGMGFTRTQATKALKNCNNNGERALDWIFSHQEELEEGPVVEPEFKDGGNQYKLVGFVSHMGTSSMVGHYVVHLLKEGRWVIINDNKVAQSENPPKELGYFYLYERL